MALWKRSAKDTPDVRSGDDLANAHLNELDRLAERLDDAVSEIALLDDYTAGGYGYCFGASAKHARELCNWSPLPHQKAIREAFHPLLFAPEFDLSAWVSVLGTGALWLAIHWAGQLPAAEGEYVLSWAPAVMEATSVADPDVTETLLGSYTAQLSEGNESIHNLAANAMVLAASDGQITLRSFGPTAQDGSCTVLAWDSAVERFRAYMANNDFEQRARPQLQARVAERDAAS